MEKRVVRKEDGRYLIFYAFERPLPEIDSQRATPVEADAGKAGADAPAKGPREGGDA